MVPVPIPAPKHTPSERRPALWLTPFWIGLAIAMHGILLGIPLPEADSPPEEPKVALLEEPPPLDVTVLPEGFVETLPSSEAPAPEAAATGTAPSRAIAERPALPPEAAQFPPVPEQSDDPESPTDPPPDPTDLPSESGLTPPSEPPPPPTLDTRLRDRQFYVPNQKTIGDSEATGIFNEWYGRMVASGAVYKKANPPLNVLYPLTDCLPVSPDIGSLGVFVDAAGSIQTVELLKSTGYDVLDEKATVDVQSYAFPNSNQATAYSLEIRVDYHGNNCQ